MLLPQDKKLRRSSLFCPATYDKALEKIAQSDADVVILDLEDAIPQEDKLRARENLLNKLNSMSFGNKEVVIRINPLTSAWGKDDLEALKDHPKVHAFCIPKAETAAGIQEITAITAKPLWLICETPKAIENIKELAESSPQVEALCMGSGDLSADIGVESNNKEALKHARDAVLYTARAHNKMALDGPSRCLDFGGHNEENVRAFKQDCDYSRECGYDGKVAVHPKQIEYINKTFSPTSEEVKNAEQVINAAKKGGMANMAGILAGPPHVKHANNVIALQTAVQQQIRA